MPAIGCWRRSGVSRQRSCAGRSRLPGGRRRVRRHPPEFGCRDRPGGRSSDARGGTARWRPECAHRAFSLSVGVSAFPIRAVTPASCTDTPTRPSTGASVTAGPPWSPTTRATTARPAAERPIAELAADVATVLAKRALRPVYQPDLLAGDRPAGRLRGPRPTDGRGAIRRRWLALRRGRGGGPDGRARPALPGASRSPPGRSTCRKTRTSA